MYQRECAFGRTEEEALSKLDAIMIRKHPDEPFSRQFAKVYPYGNENSEFKFIAEYIF